MLKLLVKYRILLDRIIDLRYLENLLIKLFIVIGWLIEYGGW